MPPNGEMPHISGKDRFCYHEEQLKLEAAVGSKGGHKLRLSQQAKIFLDHFQICHQFEIHLLWVLTILIHAVKCKFEKRCLSEQPRDEELSTN